MKAIIIDDEPKLREVLKIKLREYCSDVEILDVAENAVSAYEKINQLNPDVIFLDIAMPGETGFELLERFEKFNFEIIFVTGFNEYALDALKVSAVDYILKPVGTDDLIEAVKKAKRRIKDRQTIERYEVLKHNLSHVGDQKTKIAVPGTTAYDFILISSIIRCEGWQKYTKIFLENGECIVSSYNLGVFKDLLNNYGFYNSHKSHLVNKEHISRYLKEGIIVMSDQSRVPVARRRKEEFLELFIKNTIGSK